MSTYIVTQRAPCRDDYNAWCAAGYLGSYEKYAEAAWQHEGGRIFISGDLGPHCAECAAPHDVLCDYPVGERKTCDRALCRDHAHAIGRDIDYCTHHHAEWLAFASTNAVMDQLTAIAEGRMPTQPDASND